MRNHLKSTASAITLSALLMGLIGVGAIDDADDMHWPTNPPPSAAGLFSPADDMHWPTNPPLGATGQVNLADDMHWPTNPPPGAAA